ncbi:MAG: class I SAM-dependent methyltransferase [Crocinitomicaceae bacterium]
MSEVPKVFTEGWKDYELIDAGGGKKLERWGDIITIRPEVQAYFRSGKPFEEWNEMAHWEFHEKGSKSGVWKQLKEAPEAWTVQYNSVTFELRLTKFKHLGLFPEQRTNWDFIQERLQEEGRFLNLFAYTGAASLMARTKKAETIHVDSVKQLISWARENMEQSDLMNIKWVHEDALKFASRELKRGNQYSGIIMDPPAWGIGAKKEKWKLEDKLNELIQNASQLLTPDGFLILNTYSPQVSSALLKELSALHFKNRAHQVSELWMHTTTGKKMYFGNMLRVG